MHAPISLATALAFCSLNVCFALLPGPNMLCIMTSAVAHGRSAGWMTCLGIATANLFYSACLVSGFSAVLVAVPAAYMAIKIAGAIYLAWIGVRMIRRPLRSIEPKAPSGWSHPFAQGAITSLLNPKIALFAVMVIPQFVDARRAALLPQIAALCALWILSGTSVNLVTGTMAAAAQGFLRTRPRWFEAVQRTAGAALLGIAARIAFVHGRG